MIVTIKSVIEARDRLEQTENAFLEKNGWKYTCNHPGAYWLWGKKINGKDYICNKSMALALQSGLKGEETGLDLIKQEHEEICARFNKLEAFINSENFALVRPEEQDRLKRQSESMAQYSNILLERMVHYDR